MTTTILPGAGAGCLFTQQGVGTTPGYAALDDRRSNSAPLQEGVVGTPTLVTAGGVANTPNADFMVTQRNAGANMSVDVNMPSGGFAFVQGDTITGQGLYGVPVHSVNINEAIAGADPSNPRIDQIILEVQDNVLDASGGNQARTRVLTGTATAGATLANRNGAAALPGTALLLGDVLVGAGVTSVGNAVIRDRRKWARGASITITRSAGNYTTASTSATFVDSVNLQPRVELSGLGILKATLRSTMGQATSGATVNVVLAVDGVATNQGIQFITAAANQAAPCCPTWESAPAGGSHPVGPAWYVSAGTGTLYATGTFILEFTIEEVVRQNAANNTVTSG